MGQRRAGRELALQVAYILDQEGMATTRIEDILLRDLPLRDVEEFSVEDPESAAAGGDYGFWGRRATDADLEGARSFAIHLVRGTWESLPGIDAVIAGYTENWSPDRMAMVDRNILRLACWEILHSDIPPKATINEWIEIAKKYSTEGSGAFINGILDRVHRERSGTPAGGDPKAGSDGEEEAVS
jgi:transcription antitermination factor NusB